MKAVISPRALPTSDAGCFVDATLPDPGPPAGHDLRVRVEAVSVNPVDTKARMQRYGGSTGRGGEAILGWDAAGTVDAVGPEVSLFRPGDAVYYAGTIGRPGSNAELQLVDERIVSAKPRSLDWADAAAVPLTAITAYEAIVDRLGVDPEAMDRGKSVLVIAGAGGAGSMAIQIGRLLGLEVIATASRAESTDWCRALGASAVIDHRAPLAEGLKAAGHGEVDCVLLCADTDGYWPQLADVIKPQGAICSIVRTLAPVALNTLMAKCARFSWEAMFARSSFGTPDMIEQHRILERVAAWIDAGQLRSTATERLSPINAENLRAAHARVESGRMIGKIVLSGWK
ncbi:MAG: NADPH:quinone reductase [Betaproteobacteria bacterium SG8_39]|nr:MAG: NADPH:quinone reductase [Betaproteobacteria bacterium SG8_39]